MDEKGGYAPSLLVTVRMCNCSGHGTCNFAELQEGQSLTAPFQLVTCNCETGYEGRFPHPFPYSFPCCIFSTIHL